MNKEILGGSIGTALSVVGTAIQVDEVLKYVSLAITIIGGIISMIIIPILNWYKKSKEDGKISKEELEEGIKIISDGIDSVKDKTQDKQTKKGGH